MRKLPAVSLQPRLRIIRCTLSVTAQRSGQILANAPGARKGDRIDLQNTPHSPLFFMKTKNVPPSRPVTILLMSDFDEARKKAECGSVVGQGYMGWCYLYGRETEVSYLEALRWLSAAAYEGRASRPFVHLGDMYAAGLGVVKNISEAIRHYKAVVGSELRAQLALARIYSQGDGVNADSNEAWRLYSSLAGCKHVHDDPAIAAFAGALTSAEVEEAKAYIRKH